MRSDMLGRVEVTSYAEVKRANGTTEHFAVVGEEHVQITAEQYAVAHAPDQNKVTLALTVACPVCKHVHPYVDEECVSCGCGVEYIKEAPNA